MKSVWPRRDLMCVCVCVCRALTIEVPEGSDSLFEAEKGQNDRE
jgi:hypothetical protein